MKLNSIIFITTVILLFCSAFDKDKFDLKQEISNKKADGYIGQRISLGNQMEEITLMNGGFFTLGTRSGYPGTSFDDYCTITFGHPFAFTSLPLINFDGQWKTADQIYANKTQYLYNVADTLVWIAIDSFSLKTCFYMIFPDSGHTVELLIETINLDVVPHTVAGGLLLDPALGKSGDGVIKINNSQLFSDTLLTGPFPSSLNILERPGNPSGMALRLDFNQYEPDSLLIDNWIDIYSRFIGGENPSNLIYDLAFCLKYPAIELQPLQKNLVTLVLYLPEPEISELPVLRWNLPGFVTLDNNKIAPSSISSFAEIVNEGMEAFPNLSLIIEANGISPEWASEKTFSLDPGETSIQEVGFSIPDLYEDTVMTLNLKLMSGLAMVDNLTKPIFIPSVPFTDSGLAVEIDTLITSEHPFLDLRLRSMIQETGQLIYDLKKSNVFLYEDDERIYDFTLGKDLSGGENKADIVFVLDVTGSMSNEIDGVKDNLLEFTDSLSYRGIDFRLGMVTFLDVIENTYDFTNDVQLFHQYIKAQYAHGGADEPENSLEALSKGASFNFRPGANRIIIWITDANYHINDGQWTQLTKQEVIDEMLLKGITVHCIGEPVYQTDYYDQIVMATGGNYYNINGNFRDILLDVSRLKTSAHYIITFVSQYSSGSHKITAEIHYAGLGGVDSVQYTLKKNDLLTDVEPAISCNPNPFHPQTLISIRNISGLNGTLDIYNITGQQVATYYINQGTEQVEFVFDMSFKNFTETESGLYLLKLMLYDQKGELSYMKTEKLIYLK